MRGDRRRENCSWLDAIELKDVGMEAVFGLCSLSWFFFVLKRKEKNRRRIKEESVRGRLSGGCEGRRRSMSEKNLLFLSQPRRRNAECTALRDRNDDESQRL